MDPNQHESAIWVGFDPDPIEGFVSRRPKPVPQNGGLVKIKFKQYATARIFNLFNTTVLNTSNLRWFTSPFCFICLCNQIHTTVPVYCICKASFDILLFKESYKNSPIIDF